MLLDMKALRGRLKVLISLDSLITGDKLFHSLLTKKVENLCVHSK